MSQIITLNGVIHDLDYKPSLAIGQSPNRRTPIIINGQMVHGVNINGYSYPPAPANSVLYFPGLPGYGSTIWDRSGTNHGTITGATPVRLPSGLWYLDYDGTDDIVTVTAAASIQNIFDSPGGTILWWMKPDSDGETDAGRTFSKGEATSVGHRSWVGSEAGGFVKRRLVQYFNTQPGQWASTNAVFPVGTWSFNAMTYDNSNAANNPLMYLNGVSQAVTVDLAPIGTRQSDAGTNLAIGNNIATTTTFDGGIALIRFIKGAILTAAQIQNIYNQERQLLGV